jgi:hypothetical protein
MFAMKKFALGVAGLAALLATPALAQRGGERPNPDANGDGIVTRAEVDADVAKRFARMDVNKDGKVDKADREAAMAARGGEGGGDGKRKERRGPMRADADGDGAVTLAEMRAAAGRMFERVDADKDGKLTAAEREAVRGMRGEGRRGAPPPAG